MCKECGCGLPGPYQIDGRPAEQVESPIHQEPGEPGAPAPASTPTPIPPGEPGQSHSHPHTHSHPHPHSHTHPHSHGHPHDHDHGHEHDHEHPHPHTHEHPHDPDHAPPAAHSPSDPGTTPHRQVEVHQSLLAGNDRLAERNRGFFQALGTWVVNVLASPGSGKTTLIEQTLRRIAGRTRAAVIVGDLATDRDAERLRTTGVAVVQITTGTVCHLEAGMIARALGRIDSKNVDLLFIENVGNLVCPAAFDLGENCRVVLLSTTEGEDKPLKYPPMFLSADVVVVTKIDMAEAAGFNRDLALANIGKASPRARVFELSARTGQGMEEWCDFLMGSRRLGLTLRPSGS